MPIPVNSDAWADGESRDRLHNRLLEFLRKHPDKVFRPRELSDELLDTSWEAGRKREELRQELSEEEYHERAQNDELPGEDIIREWEATKMAYIEMAIDQLRGQDQIEIRQVDADAFDIPYDWDTTTGITYREITLED